MRKRPIVVLVCMYMVGLIWVLVFQPELGEKLFGWEEKEKTLQQQYETVTEVEGLVLSVQKKAEGGRARLRLPDENECILILSEEAANGMKTGSRIWAGGEIWWPEAATNPGQWDGLQYARIQGFDFYMRVAKWECLKEKETLS